MSSTNKTPTLGLNQWVLTDPFLMEDMNADNQKIDSAIVPLSMEKISHIVTAASCVTLDLDVSGIDWSRYFEVIIYCTLKHDGQAGSYVYTTVRGNRKSGSTDYFTRCTSPNSSAAKSDSSHFFSCNDTNYTDGQSRTHVINIFKGNGCTLFKETKSFNDNRDTYAGVLKSSSSSSIPLALSELQTLNFYCAYGVSTGLTSAVFLLPGCEFQIYGVKK